MFPILKRANCQFRNTNLYFWKMSNFFKDVKTVKKTAKSRDCHFFFLSKRRTYIDKSKSKRNLHIMYELGVGYDVSNTTAPRLGLVVSAWWDPSLLKVSRLLFFLKTFLKILSILLRTFLTDPRFVMSKKNQFFLVCSTQQKSQEF